MSDTFSFSPAHNPPKDVMSLNELIQSLNAINDPVLVEFEFWKDCMQNNKQMELGTSIVEKDVEKNNAGIEERAVNGPASSSNPEPTADSGTNTALKNKEATDQVKEVAQKYNEHTVATEEQLLESLDPLQVKAIQALLEVEPRVFTIGLTGVLKLLKEYRGQK